MSLVTVNTGEGQSVQLSPVAGAHVQLAIGPFCITALRLVIVPVDKLRSVPRSIVGLGSTLTTTVFGEPVHPLANGVTVMVALTGKGPGLIPLNAAILPVPLDANPIDGALFVQLKLAPATLPEKAIALVATPSQIL